MTANMDYGRLWFSPWLARAGVTKTLDALLSRGLSFGGTPEVNIISGNWVEICVNGPEVEGLLLDAEGLIADPEDIIDVLGPLFDQNMSLTCRGLRYGADAIISSTMVMHRVGEQLSCSIERIETKLETGRRLVLLNQQAETGHHANVHSLRAGRA